MLIHINHEPEALRTSLIWSTRSSSNFNLLLGIGIATPIIQSIIRHVEADGFGEEIAQDYENWVNEINRLIEVSTPEMQRIAEGFMPEST